MAAKENKDLLERGQKHRAGRLISEYLRAVGQEKTEVATIFIDPDTGEKRIISKAEAMARDIWKKALESEDAKEKLEYRKIIIDRCDGKGEERDKDRGNVPDRVSRMNKERINRMAEGDGKKKAEK
jgi:hypothetical protein